ncbi:MAG: hypothetical protein UY41_C0023G0003 [Candidatus Moranbacteria bacterium GW2011_GWE1_49_15]|nr:MAG: hypothetical protein UX75_C0039G0014 [Candidatus Moranbacteria bacterium GW2011_GWE2_47_10]KKW06488.1 MAG: hypothetical protein UY41_C0023G0003 [Candidatus Moranbacteria bacterium GW2011_GWE1_49_15]
MALMKEKKPSDKSEGSALSSPITQTAGASGSMNGNNVNIRAREICRRGNFEKSYVELRQLGLLDKEVAVTEKLFKEELGKLYPLSRKDLEMLSVIRLFDSKTFYHSVETYATAKKKIARPLESGSTFLDMLKNEGVSPEQFWRACLFHDIGKVVIPKFLLNSNYTDENWAQAFIQLSKRKAFSLMKKYAINIAPALLDDPETLMEHMIRNRIRGARFVPIKTLFSKKQIKLLESRGFSSNMSLIDIMQKHEKESEKILDFMGYPVEAKIAGSHHNYEIANKNIKKRTCTCSIADKNLASDIIHLADIQEALRSNRPYLAQRPVLKTLAFMVDDARRGLVNCFVAYLWIKDDMQKIDSGYLDLVLHHSEDDPEHGHLKDRKIELNTIQEFLAETEKWLKTPH